RLSPRVCGERETRARTAVLRATAAFPCAPAESCSEREEGSPAGRPIHVGPERNALVPRPAAGESGSRGCRALSQWPRARERGSTFGRGTGGSSAPSRARAAGVHALTPPCCAPGRSWLGYDAWCAPNSTGWLIVQVPCRPAAARWADRLRRLA